MRRLLLIPPVLLLVNLLGVGYAWLAQIAQGERSPFRAPAGISVPAEIVTHAGRLLRGDFGLMPNNQGPVITFVAAALGHSFLVLLLAFVTCTALGLVLGMRAARHNPNRLAAWMLPVATLTASIPSFYLGVLLSAALIAASIGLAPVQNHWLLPVVVLAIRPSIFVAQLTANLILGEADKHYVVAARAFGHTFASVRRAHMLPNVIAPVIQSLATTFRLMVAELIVIEWLFNWPGIGRLLANTLIVPRRTDAAAPLFLHPELTAACITALVLLFLLADLVAGMAARSADPRLRTRADAGAGHGGGG